VLGGPDSLVVRRCGALNLDSSPADDLRLAVDGATILSFAVMHDGTTADIWVLRSSGSKFLDQAAFDAISKATYQPATVDGKAVDLQWRAAVTWQSQLSRTPHRLPDLSKEDQYLCEFDLPGAVAACSNVIAAAASPAPAYFWRAIAYDRAGDRTNALNDFGRAFELDPDNTDALRGRATDLVVLDRNEEALADLNRALSRQPNDDGALLLRALVYEALGQNDNAQKDYAAVMSRAPDCVPARAANCSDLEKRIKELDYATSQNPKDADALNASCTERALLNRQLEKAEADCNAGLALASDYPPLHVSLALVYLRLGRFGDALKELEKAPLPKSGAEALYMRGIARLRSGDNGGGKADLVKAEEMDPGIATSMAYAGVTP
jgi:TonB family protein